MFNCQILIFLFSNLHDFFSKTILVFFMKNTNLISLFVSAFLVIYTDAQPMRYQILRTQNFENERLQNDLLRTMENLENNIKARSGYDVEAELKELVWLKYSLNSLSKEDL